MDRPREIGELGFSNGGTTTVQITIRHPELVDKIILGSALCKRSGIPAQFWDFMKQATFVIPMIEWFLDKSETR